VLAQRWRQVPGSRPSFIISGACSPCQRRARAFRPHHQPPIPPWSTTHPHANTHTHTCAQAGRAAVGIGTPPSEALRPNRSPQPAGPAEGHSSLWLLATPPHLPRPTARDAVSTHFLPSHASSILLLLCSSAREAVDNFPKPLPTVFLHWWRWWWGGGGGAAANGACTAATCSRR
jgi:hypothetical protein